MWQRLSRSELLSTFFPTWIWQGREWAKWRIPKYDPYYWLNAHAHPVTSTYYFPSSLLSIAVVVFKSYGLINKAFQLLCWSLLAHVLFGFIGWYCLVNSWSNIPLAIFGALTFTLAGYNWKQQPCFQYTVAWFPWLLLGISKGSILLSGISFGMILLAGYYPIGIQIALIAGCATIYWNCLPYWIPLGLIIGLPQLIPFLKYLPKTIRTNKVSDIGKVPWWHVVSLVFPKAFRHSINAVGFWEMSYYIGIIPLLTIWYTTSVAWVLVVVGSLLMLGVCGKHLPRIPARWVYTFQFGLIWSALDGLNNLHLSNHLLILLCLLQGYDLLHNNLPLLVNHPYSEIYQKPSWAFNTRITRYLEVQKGDFRVSGLPYPMFTGHINKIKTLGYSGGMQLKLMAKWRNDKNSDGSGNHDFFKGDGNINDLERFRVRFCVTGKKLDWPSPVPHLYINPNVSS